MSKYFNNIYLSESNKIKITKENVIKAVKGDEDSIEQIIKYFYSYAYQKAKKYFIKSGMADIEDLIQSGLYGVYTGIQNLNENNIKNNFKNYFKICIDHRLKSEVRRVVYRKKHSIANNAISMDKKSYKNSDDKGREMHVKFPDTPQKNPEVKMLYNNLYFYFEEKIIENLTSLELKVLKEYIKGLSYKEIANNLDIGVKSVDNALTRAKEKTRKYFKDISDIAKKEPA